MGYFEDCLRLDFNNLPVTNEWYQRVCRFGHGIGDDELVDSVIQSTSISDLVRFVERYLKNDSQFSLVLLFQYRILNLAYPDKKNSDILHECKSYRDLSAMELDDFVLQLCKSFVRTDSMYELSDIIETDGDSDMCDELLDYAMKLEKYEAYAVILHQKYCFGFRKLDLLL